MSRNKTRPLAAIRLDDPPIDVRIRRSARARRLTLRLSADQLGATLTVPERTPDRTVHRFLTDHSGWIRSRMGTLPPEVWPRPGTTLTVGGEALVLAAAPVRGIRRDGGQLLIGGAVETWPARLGAWLREAARARAQPLVDRHAAQIGRPCRQLTLRDPRSRWGSCTTAGNIMLSWRLVLAPAPVLNYVAAHEVAHLAEMNHSAAFWAVVRQLDPGFEEWRAWLREEGAALHRVRVGRGPTTPEPRQV